MKLTPIKDPSKEGYKCRFITENDLQLQNLSRPCLIVGRTQAAQCVVEITTLNPNMSRITFGSRPQYHGSSNWGTQKALSHLKAVQFGQTGGTATPYLVITHPEESQIAVMFDAIYHTEVNDWLNQVPNDPKQRNAGSIPAGSALAVSAVPPSLHIYDPFDL